MSLSLCPPPSCRFGGGPAVNHLYVCSICQVEIEALAKRRRVEIDTFIKVHARGGGVGGLGTPGDLRTKSHVQSGSVCAECSVGDQRPEVWPD